jgi:5-methylcytosine-specific restriction endonuclease McrA
VPRWPEKGRVKEIHQTETGYWSALIECPDGVVRRFKTGKEAAVAGYVKRQLRRPVKDRYSVLARDEFTCRYCGAKAPDVRLVVDHIVPVSKGGTDEPANLITACEPCNAGKSDRHSGGVVEPTADLYRTDHERAVEAIDRFARHLENG